MGLLNFKDWLDQHDESSAFTRLRKDAALGLKPPIPGAAVNSRSTASPFEVEKLGDKKKKKKKKKKGKKKTFLDEAKKLEPVKHPEVDNWLDKIAGLKGDVDKSKEEKDKLDKEPKDKIKDKKDPRC